MRFLFGTLHIISIITVSMRKPINHTTTYDIINTHWCLNEGSLTGGAHERIDSFFHSFAFFHASAARQEERPPLVTRVQLTHFEDDIRVGRSCSGHD